MAKTKVIHVNPTLEVGGMETMIVQLCNHLNKKRFIVQFCSLCDNMPKAKEFDNSVVAISLGFKSNLRGHNLILNFGRCIRRLGKYLKKERPDIVHVHGLFTIYLLVAIAVKLYFPQARVVKTIHTSGLFYSSHKFIDRFRLYVEKIATQINKTDVVGISEQVTKIAKREFGGVAVSITKIYNGVNVALFEGMPDVNLKKNLGGNKYILVAYVARIVNGKNHDFLVEIWHELKKRGVDFIRLIFIGDGENTTHIEQKISGHKLEQEIICLGQCSNVPELLKCCDFAIFPSDYEGFSLALIEKMAAGLPVIASDISPFKEVITTGKNGLIKSITEKEGWLEAIETLSMNDSLRKTLGNAAKERSKDFSIELMTEGYENLYTHEGFF